jgi:hypothetical protein
MFFESRASASSLRGFTVTGGIGITAAGGGKHGCAAVT